jgi:hypothetical protein
MQAAHIDIKVLVQPAAALAACIAVIRKGLKILRWALLSAHASYILHCRVFICAAHIGGV